mmetsp:Transcript_91526/g.259154  ORF Transcript_91526/g.259154 Transcript_91526/m.259154 type:complete len:551 (+) Transcript_91526:59-1711(+)
MDANSEASPSDLPPPPQGAGVRPPALRVPPLPLPVGDRLVEVAPARRPGVTSNMSLRSFSGDAAEPGTPPRDPRAPAPTSPSNVESDAVARDVVAPHKRVRCKRSGPELAARGDGGRSPKKPDPRPAKPPNPSPQTRCKLSVHYREGERPMDELVRLGGGQGVDVIVEVVAPDSKAHRAGIKPGFALTLMNGRSEFMQLPGWQVRLLLEAPITLGFDPEPMQPTSMRCTEIRLTGVHDELGIPPRVAVCRPNDTGLLADEVVFSNAAPLWLSAWNDERFGAAPDVAAASGVPRVYELRRPEATLLVGHAMRGARNYVSKEGAEQTDDEVWEAEEWFPSTASRRKRMSSPGYLCSLDCVAECIENEPEDADRRPHQRAIDRHLVTSKPHAARGAKDLPGRGHKDLAGLEPLEPHPLVSGGSSSTTAASGSSSSADTQASSSSTYFQWLRPVLSPFMASAGPAHSPQPEPSQLPRGREAASPRRLQPTPGLCSKPAGAAGDAQVGVPDFPDDDDDAPCADEAEGGAAAGHERSPDRDPGSGCTFKEYELVMA